ncbi:AMP-dependent synthetase/ligase [Candidatus Synechococcus spongiarum]|nr:AMP-binding protein [Candidatus Synechococcus spongiarum]
MSSQSKAHIAWQATRADVRVQQSGPDWSGLKQLHDLWPELTRRHGSLEALNAPHATPPETFTFAELEAAIDTTRTALHSLGLGGDDVVALLADNGPRWLIADQAVMSCGAADAVRGSTAPVEELHYIIEDCNACGLILQDQALLERLQSLPLSDHIWQQLRFVVLLTDEPHPAELGWPGQQPRSNGTPVPLLSWSRLQQRVRGKTVRKAAVLSGEAVATILYTSGTTGRPKGVPLRHRNLIYLIQQLIVAVQPNPGEQTLSVLPIWHSYERAAGYFLLSCGCRQNYTTIRDLRDDLQNVRPHFLISVPRLWESIQESFNNKLRQASPSQRTLVRSALACSRFHCEQWRAWQNLHPVPCNPARRLLGLVLAGVVFPLHRLAGALLWPKLRQKLVGGRLRLAISGGGALSPSVDGFFEAVGIELLVGYGLTETSPVLTARRPWRNRRGGAGQPLPGTEIRIVATEQTMGPREVVGWGQTGIVQARGPQVMGGYLGRPEATARVLDGENWFDTGDLGYLLRDGSLMVTGRAKDTIVLANGENIEPTPLEDALLAHPLVQQVMVVGQDRRTLAALVVLDEPALNEKRPAEPDQLMAVLRREFNQLLAQRRGSRREERLSALAFVDPFTMDNGLLTQTLKQRRDRIAATHQAQIDALYTG